MSGWIECATPGCPGDMRYAAPGRGHIPGCTAPVTASDARPPSDTGTTGDAEVWFDAGDYEIPPNGTERTLICFDPAEARETIARAIWESDMAGDLMPGRFTWESEPDRAMYLANADAVLAALTESDVRSDTGSASDPVSKKKGYW